MEHQSRPNKRNGCQTSEFVHQKVEKIAQLKRGSISSLKRRNRKIAVFTFAWFHNPIIPQVDSLLKLLIVRILFLFNSKPKVFSSDVGKHFVNQFKKKYCQCENAIGYAVLPCSQTAF